MIKLFRTDCNFCGCRPILRAFNLHFRFRWKLQTSVGNVCGTVPIIVNLSSLPFIYVVTQHLNSPVGNCCLWLGVISFYAVKKKHYVKWSELVTGAEDEAVPVYNVPLVFILGLLCFDLDIPKTDLEAVYISFGCGQPFSIIANPLMV